MSTHQLIIGERAVDRLAMIAGQAEAVLVARCHRQRRGPYTGIDTVLSAVLPEAMRHWPELVEQHRVELLYGMPELAELIGPSPRTLADEASFKERTRFYGASMVRCMSQGIVTFLRTYAVRSSDAGLRLPPLVFDEVHAAAATTLEFLALLLRRVPAELWPIAVGMAEDTTPPAELRAALATHATRLTAPAASATSVPRPGEELARSFVEGDGTSDDPAEREAYAGLSAADRARLHDQRADRLTSDATWGVRVGAITYHREHGSDPGGAGRAALREAQRWCVRFGVSDTIVDLGFRGRALLDPQLDEQDYIEFTNHLAAALVPLGRLDESMQLYLELRRLYANPKLHMTSSYAMAMMYTRFLRPRDHATALSWQNNAVAIANLLPDPADRLTYSVFQANALALIEMHRGNLEQALELVEGGISRLDAALGTGEWVLHRSQLRYNRARLNAALGKWQEAYADFTILIEQDPYYTDYLSERAKISRKLGDLHAALADYDRAVQLAPPYPELYYNRATARLALDDVDGALADLNYVLDMEPTDTDSRLVRAEILLAQDRLEEAQADADSGLTLHPDEPRLLCMSGSIAMQRSAYTTAARLLEDALKSDPAYPAALVNLAVVRYKLDEPTKAIPLLDRALEEVGPDPDLLLNRGIAHHAAGAPQRAIVDFDAALELDDADVPELRSWRDRCLAEAERTHVAEARAS